MTGQILKLDRNKTRLDCKKESFSGLRQDNITRSVEIWVMGNLAVTVENPTPQGIAFAYEQVFGLHPGSVRLMDEGH